MNFTFSILTGHSNPGLGERQKNCEKNRSFLQFYVAVLLLPFFPMNHV